MEPEGPSPLSQQYSTCPHPEPDQCSPYPKPIFWCSSLILSSHPCLRYSKSFLSLGFPQQNPICTSPSFVLHISPISYFFIWWLQFMKLFIIQYNLTKIILQSVADHNRDFLSTAVYFTNAATEGSKKTFHWLITFHPNLTCPYYCRYFNIFHLNQIFHAPLSVSFSILIFSV